MRRLLILVLLIGMTTALFGCGSSSTTGSTTNPISGTGPAGRTMPDIN